MLYNSPESSQAALILLQNSVSCRPALGIVTAGVARRATAPSRRRTSTRCFPAAAGDAAAVGLRGGGWRRDARVSPPPDPSTLTMINLAPDVRALIAGPVPTRLHADALAAVSRPGAGPWTPTAIAATVGCEGSVVRRCLAELAAAGLIRWTADGACRYSPATLALRRASAALLRLHDERPQVLARALLHRPVKPRSGAGTAPSHGRAAIPLVHGAS